MVTRVVKLVIENLDGDEIEIQEHYAHAVTNDWQDFVTTVQEKYGGEIAERLLSLPLRRIGIFNLNGNGMKVFVFSSDSPVFSNSPPMQYTEVVCIDLLDQGNHSKIEFEGRNPVIRRVYRYEWRYCYKYTYKHT